VSESQNVGSGLFRLRLVLSHVLPRMQLRVWTVIPLTTAVLCD